MSSSGSIESAITLAENRWPGLEFRRKTAEEASSSCPFCHQATQDGFLIFRGDGTSSPRYWCRKCGQSGFLDDDDPHHRLTPEEITEIRLQRLERKQDEHDSRVTALERMAHCHDHVTYHENLHGNEDAFEWFSRQGFEYWAIFDYKLGVCPRCPTDREGRPSYTFPIWRKDGPLWSIRHRLQGATNGDKYRPHRKALGLQLVNARCLNEWRERVILIEGCKKTRILQQHDLPVVGILGKTGFEMRWLNWFAPGAAIYIALDPDAQDAADKLGYDIAKAGKEVYVAKLPEKPDDMLVNGGSVADLECYLKLGRRVH